jgi:hypothetical protein
MSTTKRARAGLPIGHLTILLLLAVVGTGILASISGASPASAAIGQVCPTPPSQVMNGIDVCVDRGDNATYQAGDRITVCVSANIPQIMIFPPPPPPAIKVEDVAADGSSRLLIEAQMVSGQQCATGIIMEPFGQETIRAQALGQDGTVFQEDTTTIITTPASAPR